jgi:tetratricopeptide (TPR) repeat protein
MVRDSWFRQTSWDAQIEEAFQKKLGRAREKSQYLRIQAGILASRNPEIALRLLDQYFDLGEHLDWAQAYVDRATAYLNLDKTDLAIAAYEAALAREDSYPKVLTQAYLELPFIIATTRLSARYEQALSVLEKNKARLTFPADRFKWNSALALIRAELGQLSDARDAARAALAAASEPTSGMRFHRHVGIVRSVDDALYRRLRNLAGYPN